MTEIQMTKKLITAVLGFFLAAVCLNANDSVRDTLGLAKSVSRNPADILSGKVSGVRVSSTDGGLNGMKNVNIRGLNTIHGDSQPIWIVDGAVLTSSATENRDLFFKSDYAGRSYLSPINNFDWLNSYEIESIKVIKDMSEASLYGAKGANGVIIVTTRKATSGERNFHLNSNAGVDFRPKVGEAFRSGFFHNHDLGVDGKIGSNSFYKFSGFLRQNNGSVRGENDRSMGIALNFETRANSIFKFGLNSFINYGQSSNTSGTNYIGATSTMILSRYPDSYYVDTVEGWLSDYDDDTETFRTVNSVNLQIDFFKGFFLRLSGGIDYENQNRIVWFGDNTSFGHEVSGAAGVMNNSLINYNTKAELSFTRNFAVRHHFEAGLAADFQGYFNRTNAMCASDFDLPYMRGKGISTSTGSKRIRKFARNRNDLGGYGFAKYDYDGLFGLNASFRADKNFQYGAGAMLYPAADAFVDFRKLFFSDSRAVSSLKLTGGFGVAGKETDLPYEYLTYFMENVPSIPKYAEYYYDGVNLLTSREYNIGLNFGFLSDRLAFELKWYDKTTSDKFTVYDNLKVMSDLYMSALNWEVYDERESVISNRGLEFSTDLHLIKSGTADWSVYANAAWNMNRLVTVDEEDASSGGVVKGLYYAPVTAGGKIGGNAIPAVHGGFGTTVRVSRFTLEAKFTGAAGFDVINGNLILKKWENEITEDCIEKGDFLRLDHVGLSYDIPVKAKWIRGLRAHVSGHNLFTATRYGGWNPDVNSYGVCVRSAGMDYGSYPLARTLVMGINLKF